MSKIILYHGSSVKFKKFDVSYTGNGNDQHGPGFYLTNIKTEAERFGKFVHEVEYTPKGKLVSLTKRINIPTAKKLIMAAPDWKEVLTSNWDENLNRALNMFLQELDGQPEQEAFESIWSDFYLRQGNSPLYVQNMAKLGYDGVKVDGQEGAYMVVMFNPDTLNIIRVYEWNPEDRTEKIVELQDYTKYFNPKVEKLQEQVYTVYHGTKEPFDKFDVKRGAQGIGWFSNSVDEISSGAAGASSFKTILKCKISIKNPAGWDEYEKYGIGQLKDMGYDGVILPMGGDVINYVVFKNNQVKILKESKGARINLKKLWPKILENAQNMYDVSEEELKNMSGEEFNDGFCDAFAEAAYEVYNCELVSGDDIGFYDKFGVYPVPHAFVFYKGKYYDIEVLDGVENPFMLPIFQRQLANHKEGVNEDITLDIDKGDEILTGRFKNKRVKVKEIGKDDHGMPTVNGRQLTTVRIPKLEETYLNNTMTPQEKTALKQISRMAKTIAFPKPDEVEPRRIFWNREKGYRGQNTIQRVKDMCEQCRWVKGSVSQHSATGSEENNICSYTDTTGKYRIVFTTVYGATPEDNKYSIELKAIGVNESMSLIDKILSEALKK